MSHDDPPRRVVVLGSTGSVGAQALEVLGRSDVAGRPLQLVGLAAATSWEAVLAQATQHGVQVVHMQDIEASARAREAIHRANLAIEPAASLTALLDATEPDIVLNAVVGFAGLEATLAALERGIDVALANKESLVAAGQLCRAVAARTGARIIPVDSEHSALQQCLDAAGPDGVESLVLTASGGPFRGQRRDQLQGVTVEQALAHPTWSMGGKISIDSATLMNKGLELIEAVVLFDLPEHRVETIVHPDSIVHALTRHADGSMMAHIGWPDMRVPIAWALHHPVRPTLTQVRRLDLAALPALQFEEPDLDTFRCLALARDAARIGSGMPCVLNSANEVAVALFLAGEIGFLQIAEIVESVLERSPVPGEPGSLDDARVIDDTSRALAREASARVSRA